MNRDKSKQGQTSITRRGFIFRSTAVFFGLASFFTFLLTVLRMPLPSLLPGKSGRFKIGFKNEFPVGTIKYFENDQVHVFSDNQGIYAISAVCTHLGCIVRREENGFVCPCHGSRFDIKGGIIEGAATRNLTWYKINRLPGGLLEINKNTPVKPGEKFII